jgi:hypothetical protein
MGNALNFLFFGSSFKREEKKKRVHRFHSIPLYALPPIWVQIENQEGMYIVWGEMFNEKRENVWGITTPYKVI